MQEDLENEIEAINSIYGDKTLVAADKAGIYVLHLPSQDVSLRLSFPKDYPGVPLELLGIYSTGEGMRKGEAGDVLERFRLALGRLWQPGEVCLFDIVEDVTSSLGDVEYDNRRVTDVVEEHGESTPEEHESLETPPWTISDILIEQKSIFVARCAPISSPDQAKLYLQHLLNSDKKVAKATHNITAHRIKGEKGITFQDCDDDGETAAGGRVLHLMQLMDLWNVMVVVTRGYGGQKLGPARFGIINTVARDAFVKAGLVHEQENSTKKKGK